MTDLCKRTCQQNGSKQADGAAATQAKFGDFSKNPENVADIQSLLLALASQANPADPQTIRVIIESLKRSLIESGTVGADDLTDLPDEAAAAVQRLREINSNDFAVLLRNLAQLVESGGQGADSLEDFAAWLREHVAPILGDDEGPEVEAERMVRYRAGAASAIAAAMKARGIAPAGEAAPPQRHGPPAGSMSRHRVFWRNFEGIAPSLLRLAATPGGARAAAEQVSALLASLDLPHGVEVRPVPGGALLDLSAPKTPEDAEVLRRMLADAPAIGGWRLAVGGAEP